jgi:hypothetical protein
MYASLDEFKTWLEYPVEDDGLMDHHLEPVLLAAERWIDQHCGRHFGLENEATKLYYPNDTVTLDVVDLISITTLKLDTDSDRTYATTLTVSDYELLPYMDSTGRPSERFQHVRIWPDSTHAFVVGELAQIVGDFGYVEDGQPPSDIRLATLMLASRWWRRHHAPSGTAIVPDMGRFAATSENADVSDLLSTYDRSSASSWVLV